jgi:hypothetical protein
MNWIAWIWLIGGTLLVINILVVLFLWGISELKKVKSPMVDEEVVKVGKDEK